jgi:hypothetical protein
MQETPSDLDEEIYRTWSVPALLTGAVGAVSWLPLFSGTLIFVPLLALILGLMTWWQLNARPDHWLGARVAWFGVALSMLSLGLFAGREWSQRSWYFEGARQTAEQWLRYQKEGQPLLAYDLLRKPPKRLLVNDALRDLLAGNKEEHEKYDKYLHLKIVDLLQRHGKSLEWKLKKISPHVEIEYQKYFYVVYQVEYQENQRTESVPVEFIVERALFPADKEPRWTIMSVSSELVQGEVPLEHSHQH